MKAPETVRETADKTMVQVQVKYCGDMWDPYTTELTSKFEIV